MYRGRMLASWPVKATICILLFTTGQELSLGNLWDCLEKQHSYDATKVLEHAPVKLSFRRLQNKV